MRAFEIGCSIGVLTAQLAARCDHLLSVDVSESALNQARRRCADLPNVEFQMLAVPQQYPRDAFDLTVVSEVGYYLSWNDLEKLARKIQNHTAAGGQLLLVHWLPKVDDYPLTGDQVHEYFLALPDWNCISRFRAPQYRIELLQMANSEMAGE
jgi:cyclopropane fatty-acyl-phospholipid synthase-like methyltransferase